MASLSDIKPFVPFLLTFFVPRAISFYRTVKTAVRTRPPSKPLPAETSRGLNVLFFAILFFVTLTVPLGRSKSSENVFAFTNSSLRIPADVLFTRLALRRHQGLLTAIDEALRTKITTPVARQLYLRFGASTLLDCSFCHPEEPSSYALYHLPTNIILPHLINLCAMGLATSEPLSGFEASRWRNKATISAIGLALLDAYLSLFHMPTTDINMPSPSSRFLIAATARPLLICIFDAIIAALIYASATNRFLLFSSPIEADPEVLRRRQEHALTQTNLSLQMTLQRLRAFSVSRNAILREPNLKRTEDEYWRAVVDAETEGPWEDEEVQAAIARATGDGSINVEAMQREVGAYVDSVTQGLERLSEDV